MTISLNKENLSDFKLRNLKIIEVFFSLFSNFLFYFCACHCPSTYLTRSKHARTIIQSSFPYLDKLSSVERGK